MKYYFQSIAVPFEVSSAFMSFHTHPSVPTFSLSLPFTGCTISIFRLESQSLTMVFYVKYAADTIDLP